MIYYPATKEVDDFGKGFPRAMLRYNMTHKITTTIVDDFAKSDLGDAGTVLTTYNGG